MDWLKPVIEWVKGSVVPAAAISLASGIFAFTPLSQAVVQYQPWPLIAFVLSSAYLTVLGSIAVGKKTMTVVTRKHRERRTEQRRIDSLYRLSRDEKSLLRAFIGSNRRTIPMGRLNHDVASTANSLVDLRILRFHGNFISTRYQAFMIEEWAWEYLNENPDVLD